MSDFEFEKHQMKPSSISPVGDFQSGSIKLTDPVFSEEGSFEYSKIQQAGEISDAYFDWFRSGWFEDGWFSEIQDEIANYAFDRTLLESSLSQDGEFTMERLGPIESTPDPTGSFEFKRL